MLEIKKGDNMLRAKNYFNQLDITSQGNSMTTVGKYDEQPVLEYAEMPRQNLPIPELLQPIAEDDDKVHYYLTAKDSQTEYFKDVISPSKGFSRHVLGPVIKLKKGQNVTMTTENQLDEPLTYHWHGLMLNAEADGGPMRVVESKEKRSEERRVGKESSARCEREQ